MTKKQKKFDSMKLARNSFTPIVNNHSQVILDKKGLAAQLDVSLSTIDRWIQQGMPYVKRGGFGREWQFNLAAVKIWRYRQNKN